MDGNTMKYSFGAIEGLATDINSRVAAVESRISDMNGKINNLTQIWEGSSSGGFQATKKAWSEAAADMNATLKKIQIAVSTTNQDAQQTERMNTQRWG